MGPADRLQQHPAEGAELLARMQALSQEDSPTNRAVFYQALLAANLIVPTSQRLAWERDESGAAVLPQDEPIPLVTVENDAGERAMLAFSDLNALQAWRASAESVPLAAPTVFAIAVQNDFDAVVLNIAGPDGGDLSRREFSMLAQGMLPLSENEHGAEALLAAGGRVALAALSGPPADALLQAFWAATGVHREVREVWLFRIAVGNSDWSLAAGFCMDGASEQRRRQIFQAVGDGVHSALGEDEYVDFLALDDAELRRQAQRVGTRVG